MTPTQKSAMQSALRALRCIDYGFIDITDGPSEDTTESAIQELEAALAEPVQLEEHCLWARNDNEPCPHVQKAEQDPFLGWVFKRNTDGSIGITAPPPKPGESRRTSDCVGPQDRDLHELLGKLADHMTAANSNLFQGVK